MATFYNQATLSFNGRLTNSNVASGELRDTLALTKTALSSGYNSDGNVVYVVNINNSGNSTVVSLADNLGAYIVGGNTVYPLTYVSGSVRIFVNGVEGASPTVVAGPPLTMTDITIPTNSSLQIYYEATVNGFAPLAEGSSVDNTVTLSDNSGTIATASSTVSVLVGADLTIAKAICPSVVVDNGELTYTFVIQNSGNAEIIATDDVVVTDVFDPMLTNITVTFNGATWTEGVNYTYNETTGEFATLNGQITVPAATYTQDPTTGIITTTPGVAVITVVGTV